MSDSIKVLVVDDIAETRDHVTKLLAFEPDMQVVGAAASGQEALDLASTLTPDVVLMDINMPGMDGIETTERLAKSAPNAAIVMMSVQGEADYIRRAMLAGARGFLVKPFSSDELIEQIRQVHSRRRENGQAQVPVGPGLPSAAAAPDKRDGRVVAVFSPKGGVGRTTIAVNLAIAAVDLNKQVALVDANFQFGDVGVMLNLNPKNNSIADIVPELATGSSDAVDSALVRHATGVDVLLAPSSPEMAELVTVEHMRKILGRLKETHDVVIVDCGPLLQEPGLSILDGSDAVLSLLTLDITSIKSTRLFLAVASQLGYAEEKVQLVLNRADSSYGIRKEEVERSIGRKINHTIVSDGRAVVSAMNRGVPFSAGNKKAQISLDVAAIARSISGDMPEAETPVKSKAPAQRRLLFAHR